VPPRKLDLLLQDILQYSEITQKLAADGGFEAYSSRQERTFAIDRCLQIVGEALSQAVNQQKLLAWHISDYREIIAFRHLLTHHYYGITPRIVWGIILDDLPLLDRQVTAVLAKPFEVQGEDEETDGE